MKTFIKITMYKLELVYTVTNAKTVRMYTSHGKSGHH